MPWNRFLTCSAFVLVVAQGTITLEQCPFLYLQSAPFANLAIAGAHKAAAFASKIYFADCLNVNQQLDIATQAEAGIRFFDLDLELTGAGELRAWHGVSNTSEIPVNNQNTRFDLGFEFMRLDQILAALNSTVQTCISDFFILSISDVRCAEELNEFACRRKITEQVVAGAKQVWGALHVYTEYEEIMKAPKKVGDLKGSVFVLASETMQHTWCADCQTVDKQHDACKDTNGLKMSRLDLYAPSTCSYKELSWRSFPAKHEDLFRFCDSARKSVGANFPTIYLVDVVGPLPAPDNFTDVFPVATVQTLNFERSNVKIPTRQPPAQGAQQRPFQQLLVPQDGQHQPWKSHRAAAILTGEISFWLALVVLGVLASVVLYGAFGSRCSLLRSHTRQFIAPLDSVTEEPLTEDPLD